MMLQKQIVKKIEKDYVYATDDEKTKQIIQIKPENVEFGKKYYKFTVVAGG